MQGVNDVSNADIMAKLVRMTESMALKDDVKVAQLETVKQLRTEFQCELAPLATKLEIVDVNTKKALDETKALRVKCVFFLIHRI